MWRYFRTVVYFLLFTCGVFGSMWWLQQTSERPVVTINASHDRPADQGLPVYAQFVVTQRVTLPTLVSATRLTIPIQRSRNTTVPLVVELWRNGNALYHWEYGETTGETAQEINFIIDPPLLLDGPIDIVFSAHDLTHEMQEEAPRVFVESAGDYYSGGAYRIADNAKTGDVALTLRAEQSRFAVIREQWRRGPLLAVATIGRWITTLLVLLALPLLLLRQQNLGAPRLIEH